MFALWYGVMLVVRGHTLWYQGYFQAHVSIRGIGTWVPQQAQWVAEQATGYSWPQDTAKLTDSGKDANLV